MSTPSVCADSIISAVGPPLTSPNPNRYSERLERGACLKLRMLASTSCGLKSPLYVSAGGKWVNTRDPSIPSHRNVLCVGWVVGVRGRVWGGKYSQPDSLI